MHKPEQTRQRAYEIWQAGVSPIGSDLRPSLIAESELLEEHKPADPSEIFCSGQEFGGNAGAVEAALCRLARPR